MVWGLKIIYLPCRMIIRENRMKNWQKVDNGLGLENHLSTLPYDNQRKSDGELAKVRGLKPCRMIIRENRMEN
jgi:hypothetical protein